MNRVFYRALIIMSAFLYPIKSIAMSTAIELPAVKAIELPPPNVMPVAAKELLPVLAKEAPYDAGEIKVAQLTPRALKPKQVEKPTEIITAAQVAKSEPEYHPVIQHLDGDPADYNPSVY